MSTPGHEVKDSVDEGDRKDNSEESKQRVPNQLVSTFNLISRNAPIYPYLARV
jgi:hypothetical protein